MSSDIERLIAAHLAKPGTSWSLGAFGAIAEFVWSDAEPSAVARGQPLSRVTPRGGIAANVPEACVAHLYTTPSRHAARRRHEIAICLPRDACAMGGRATVTALGLDHDALRDEEREHELFDIGLGLTQADCLVRTADPETLALLRAAVGRSVFDPDVAVMREIPRLSPHRVFVTRCGRIEVYQSIPAPDGRSPDGPHTHVLPKLLKAGLTHAANLPIPGGLVPCLTIHLSRPDPDHATHLAQEGA